MNEAVCTESGLKEEIKEEYFSDCKFQDQCKNEVDVIRTLDCVKSESIDIKYEPLETARCLVVKDEIHQHNQIKEDTEDGFLFDSENKLENIADVDEVSSIKTDDDIKCEEIDIKYEPLEDIRLSPTENGETLTDLNQTCDEVTKPNDDSNLVDFRTNAGSSVENAADLYSLETHMYECNKCVHKTRWKSHLQRHMVVHTDPSKIEKYDCDICTYKARWEADLQRHMLQIHTDSAMVHTVAKYACNTCPYKTRLKSHLKLHLLVHMDPSKIKMYECNNCQYKARRKYHLDRHMLSHMDPSKIQMYECNNCQYKARRKSHLERHMLGHIDSKTAAHACNICSYKTQRESYFRKHMLGHTDPSKLEMYECYNCQYKTRDKLCLKRHVLIHMDPSKIKMYECNNCQHKARSKANLEKHMVVHRDPSKLKMHECNHCEYKTRNKSYLQKHMLIHTT